MKEIPILFSTPMAQAIMEGRKTMTRRSVKIADLIAEPDLFRYIGNSEEIDICRPAIKFDDRIWYEWQLMNSDASSWIERCKWKPGDILWVRESWQWLEGFVGSGYYVFKADGFFQRYGAWERDTPTGIERIERWRPSIHMPKEAARIWLQVTEIRVERLQDISEEDAIAEGVKTAGCKDHFSCPSRLCINECVDKYNWYNYMAPDGEDFPCFTAKESFKSLWCSINEQKSWTDNPWVWVVSFKVLSTTGKPDLQND